MKVYSMHSRIDFVPAEMHHAELLYEWRNDPDTRANSFNQDKLDFNDHVLWLAKAIKPLSGMDIWIALLDHTPIGTVRLDEIDGKISCTVAPKHRGKGLSKIMLQDFMKDFGDRPFFYSKIKHGNTASEKMVESAGFRVLEECLDYKLWVRANV